MNQVGSVGPGETGGPNRLPKDQKIDKNFAHDMTDNVVIPKLREYSKNITTSTSPALKGRANQTPHGNTKKIEQAVQHVISGIWEYKY